MDLSIPRSRIKFKSHSLVLCLCLSEPVTSSVKYFILLMLAGVKRHQSYTESTIAPKYTLNNINCLLPL